MPIGCPVTSESPKTLVAFPCGRRPQRFPKIPTLKNRFLPRMGRLRLSCALRSGLRREYRAVPAYRKTPS